MIQIDRKVIPTCPFLTAAVFMLKIAVKMVLKQYFIEHIMSTAKKKTINFSDIIDILSRFVCTHLYL